MTSEFAVETVDLTKVYRSGTVLVPALRGVNLKVRRREFISMVGPSESGKSNLLNILVSVALSIFAGVYPAWRASRLDPVVALRKE